MYIVSTNLKETTYRDCTICVKVLEQLYVIPYHLSDSLTGPRKLLDILLGFLFHGIFLSYVPSEPPQANTNYSPLSLKGTFELC
jgi:hypothetical protein